MTPGKLRVTFVYGPMAQVTVISVSEIRLELSGADEPKVLAAPTSKRVTRPTRRPRQLHVAAVQPNTQQQQQAEAQRKAAQLERSSRFKFRVIRAPSSESSLRL
jgi:hypothetical protein